jgi:hypothetical protein
VKVNDQELKIQQQGEMLADCNKQFPDLIDMVIDIVSDEKNTIRSKSGVEYLLSPARPEFFFRDR